jgi:hypothetical protein
MAHPDHKDDLFEASAVSSSIPPDESLAFLDEHGFFYQADPEIGNLVDRLYSEGRARSENSLNQFRPRLLEIPRISKILEPYLQLPPFFAYPWGTTPNGFFASTMDENTTGLIAYLAGAGHRWICCDGSQELHSTGVRASIGMYQIPNPILVQFPKIRVEMEQGGVLLMHPRFVFAATRGRSMAFGLMAPAD